MQETVRFQGVSRNLGWIVASVFLAIAVWLAANMSNNPLEQREMDNIRVTIQLPDGYVRTAPTTLPQVSALVRAPQNDWDLLVADDIEILADLSHIREAGEYTVKLDGEVGSPLHGNVVTIRPNTLTVTVDRVAEKRVGVLVIVSEEPPLGYTYPAAPVCDPTEVTVSGGAERVQSVDHVEVRLNLGDERNPLADQSYVMTPVDGNGDKVRNVELIPERATCSVDIQVREDITPVEVLPARSSNPPAGYLFEGYGNIEPKSVGLTGDRDAIAQLNSVVRTVPIDLSDRTETFTTDVALALPEGVQLVSENQLIQVTVIISPVRGSREFQEVPVEPIGLDTTQFRVTGLANTATVTVVGPEAELPQRDDLRVMVDLSGLSPGIHQVTATAEIMGEPDDPDITVSVNPELFTVTIEALNPTPSPSPTPTLEPGLAPAATPPPAITPTVAVTATPPGARSAGDQGAAMSPTPSSAE